MRASDRSVASISTSLFLFKFRGALGKFIFFLSSTLHDTERASHKSASKLDLRIRPTTVDDAVYMLHIVYHIGLEDASNQDNYVFKLASLYMLIQGKRTMMYY